MLLKFNSLIGIIFFINSLLLIAQDSSDHKITYNKKDNYSNEFLKCLWKIEEANFTLIDSLMIINSIDTVVFPMVYNGTFKHENIKGVWLLNYQQINYTTIKYKILSSEYSLVLEGFATINCTFYLASEVDTDDNGESYFSYEYVDGEALMIRIGERNCIIKYENIVSPLLKESAI